MTRIFNKDPDWKHILLGGFLASMVLLGFGSCQITDMEARINRLENHDSYQKAILMQRDTVVVGTDTMVREVIIRKDGFKR